MTPTPIPAARHFKAIAYLRWCIFRNGFRRKGGKGELAARILIYPIGIAMLILPVVGAFAGTYYAASSSRLTLLPLIFSIIFVLQILVSINLAPPGLSFDPQSLIRFPLSLTRFVIVRIFLGLLSASTIVGTLCFFSSAIAIAITQPRLTFIALLAALLISTANMLLIRMIFAWVDRWLSTRRSREIFTVLIFAGSLGFQYLNVTYNNVGHRSSNAQQSARYANLGSTLHRAQPVLSLLPPGLAADSILATAQSRPARAALDLSGVVLAGALFLAVFTWRMNREYRGENLSEATPQSAVAVTQPREARASLAPSERSLLPAVPPARPTLHPVILASLRKEFLYVRRNTSQFYGLVAPLAMVFILAGRLGGASRTGLVFPLAAVYSMMGVAALSYNVFGLDGAGVQLYFLAPVSFRSILIGKNLFGFLINIVQIVLLLIVLSYTAGLPGPWTLASTLSWLLLTVLLNATVGNRRSLTTPKRIDPNKLSRKQASQLSALLSLGLILALAAIGAGLILIARLYDIPWLPVPILLTFAAAALALYLYTLNHIDQLALEHREGLIEELTKISA